MIPNESTDRTAPTLDANDSALDSIRVSRIWLPMIIGLGVVGYLMYRQWNPDAFARIEWTSHALFWTLGSIAFLVFRHLCYAYRLRLLSDGHFSWRKCIELVFIWEFSSAVSPTSIGGSAVALFVFSQEKLSTAKTTTIVLYTVVLDALFFVTTLPLLFFVVGPIVIGPNTESIFDGWGYAFFTAYVFMLLYGSFFFYGLFIKPVRLKQLMLWVCKLKWLRRFREKAIELGDNFIVASAETRKQPPTYHLQAFLATAGAWSSRFLLISCLIIGFVRSPDISLDFGTQFGLYGRLESMFVIVAVSPTPGGAGLAEAAFGPLLSDYVPGGIAIIIALMWRILTYYAYLIAGAIIIPQWVTRRLRERKAAAEAQDHDTPPPVDKQPDTGALVE